MVIVWEDGAGNVRLTMPQRPKRRRNPTTGEVVTPRNFDQAARLDGLGYELAETDAEYLDAVAARDAALNRHGLTRRANVDPRDIPPEPVDWGSLQFVADRAGRPAVVDARNETYRDRGEDGPSLPPKARA